MYACIRRLSVRLSVRSSVTLSYFVEAAKHNRTTSWRPFFHVGRDFKIRTGSSLMRARNGKFAIINHNVDLFRRLYKTR